MIPEANRTIAALVAVVSIALIGVTYPLISRAWQVFEARYFSLNILEKKKVMSALMKTVLFILIFPISITFSGIYFPGYEQEVFFLVMLAVIAIFILFMPIWFIQFIIRKIKRIKQTPSKPDEPSLEYGFVLFFFAFSIFCSICSLFAVSSDMLNISIGPYNAENFNWGRWLMIDAIIFFMSGIYTFVLVYIKNRAQVLSQK